MRRERQRAGADGPPVFLRLEKKEIPPCASVFNFGLRLGALSRFPHCLPHGPHPHLPPTTLGAFACLEPPIPPAGLSLLVRTLSVLSATDNPRNGGTQAVQLTTPCWIVTRAAVLVYSSSCPYAAPPGAKRTRGSPSDHHLTLFLELPPPHLASKQERRERESERERKRTALFDRRAGEGTARWECPVLPTMLYSPKYG